MLAQVNHDVGLRVQGGEDLVACGTTDVGQCPRMTRPFVEGAGLGYLDLLGEEIAVDLMSKFKRQTEKGEGLIGWLWGRHVWRFKRFGVVKETEMC